MISLAATPRRLRCLAAALPLALLLIFILGPSPVAAEIPGIELSFDDGTDGSDDDPTTGHKLKNTAAEGSDAEPFDENGPQLQITFEGSAARTYIADTDALHGRAAEFFGGATDAIKVTSLYTGFYTPTLYAWWHLDDSTDGIFWKEDCRFEVGLDGQHKIYVKVYDESSCSATTYTSDITWPNTTDWHHLIVHQYLDPTPQYNFGLWVDFGADTDTLATDAPPAGLPSAIYFGLGIDGRVDELQAAKFGPNSDSKFDYDPEYCGADLGANTVCDEKVATADGDDLEEIGWDVPVRYKIIYDDTVCTTNDPCRVVFALSGGGGCADNYPRQDDLINRLVELDTGTEPGLAVVAVDPICWAFGFSSYPDEITQVLAVKAALASSVNFVDVSGEYYATGCSHGANNVLDWGILNEAEPASDRPDRVFVRSPSDHGEHVDCEYHTSWCGVRQRLYDEVHFGDDGITCQDAGGWEHDHEVTCIGDFFENQVAWIEPLDSTLTANVEVGRSWGAVISPNTACDGANPSNILCPEVGGFAATDGGRQFRDAWRSLEPSPGQTGYFIENRENNCQHCSLTSDQLDCVVEYLEGGRSSLSAGCISEDVVPGVAAEDCSSYPL